MGGVLTWLPRKHGAHVTVAAILLRGGPGTRQEGAQKEHHCTRWRFNRAISIRGLRKPRPTKAVPLQGGAKGVDLDISGGSIFGIARPNGPKSTLHQTLLAGAGEEDRRRTVTSGGLTKT